MMDSTDLDNDINQEKILELYNGDKDFKMIVFETFLEEIDAQMADYSAAIKSENWDELARICHKIKPSMAMVGLSKSETLLKKIEAELKNAGINEAIKKNIFDFEAKFPYLKDLVINDLNTI